MSQVLPQPQKQSRSVPESQPEQSYSDPAVSRAKRARERAARREARRVR